MGIYLVMKNNFKRSFRHKALFAVTFILPVILCIITGAIRFGHSSIRVGILGLDTNSYLSADRKEVYEILNKSDGLTYGAASKGTFQTDLILGKFHIILDYSKSRTINSFQLLGNQDEGKLLQLEKIVKEAVTKKQPVTLTGLKPKGLSVTERSITIILTLFMVLSTVHASGIIRDKQNGIVLRYQFAKLGSTGYAAGYTIYNFLIIYAQVLLCMMALLFIQKGFSLDSRELFIISLLIAVISAGFSMLICLGSKSEVQSNIMASALAVVFSLLGGTFVAIDAMPGLLRILSFISPDRWMVELLRVL
ncbi:MAG TPA: ABC transporter permease [Mobilitalea sp.]|nr:ABC transporter permease [Mobilitalea sp.]